MEWTNAEGASEPANQLVSGILSGVVLNPSLSTPYTCLDGPSESLPRIMERIFEERITRSGIASESMACHMRSTKVQMLETLVLSAKRESDEAAEAAAAATARAEQAHQRAKQLDDGAKWRKEAISKRFSGRSKLLTNHIALNAGSRRVRQGGWVVFVHGLDSISTAMIKTVQYTVSTRAHGTEVHEVTSAPFECSLKLQSAPSSCTVHVTFKKSERPWTVPLTFSRLYDEQSAIHHLDYPNHSSGHSDIVPTSGNSILGLKNPEPITSRQGLLEVNKCLPMSAADVKNTRWNGAARFTESPAIMFAPKIDSPNVA